MPIKQGSQQRVKLDEVSPFQGGVITSRQRSLLHLGGYSDIQNMRQKHPGLEQRKGFIAKHSTANSSAEVLSLFQFSKGNRTERHFLAQWSDDDVWVATDAPPTVTSGAFGTVVFTGSASSIPASWATIKDILLFSNGVDQHQLYAGTNNYVTKFIKYDSPDTAPPTIPENGIDYSYEVTDGQTSTVAVLDDLDTLANYECIFIMTPIPATRLYWTMKYANATARVGTLSYWSGSTNDWADTGEVDGTIAATGKTLGQSGAMTWSQPSAEVPHYMYGLSGYWYRWETDGALDSQVEVSSLTYGHSGTAAWVSLENVWDGILQYATEARFYDQSVGTYDVQATESIEIDDMVFSSDDTTDRVYFNYSSPISGIYIDVGSTPNTNSTTTIRAVYQWTGAAFASVGTITDGTNGLLNSGFVTWGRPSTNPEPTQFQTAKYYSYWYYFQVGIATVSDDVIISIEVMPDYGVKTLESQFGLSQCNAVWSDRAVYSFDRYSSYLYVTAKGLPMALNGDDYAILQAGDGRENKITCMKKFHNELMVWQEEKGLDGGCLTLFEGYSPVTFGKVLLSTKIGTLNAKSVAIVDGTLVGTSTEMKIKTLAFFLSHYGVFVSDGRTVQLISQDIQNYFDPTETTTCIRRFDGSGNSLDNEHWLHFDSDYKVIRIGIVSGTSATKPNIFPVFDLQEWVWSFDKYGQDFSCMTEVEAASGNLAILQYAGGTNDGAVYQMNTGTNDVDIAPVTTPIDAYARKEYNLGGHILSLREMLLTMKVQSAGNCTVTPYRNNVAGTALTLSMTAESTSEAMRRHRLGLKLEDEQLSLKFQNATASQSIYLETLGLEVYDKEGH